MASSRFIYFSLCDYIVFASAGQILFWRGWFWLQLDRTAAVILPFTPDLLLGSDSRLLTDIEQEALQIIAFGVEDTDRMIEGLTMMG